MIGTILTLTTRSKFTGPLLLLYSRSYTFRHQSSNDAQANTITNAY